ncbi:hypothetical protein CHCC16736_3519 [Bacillus licheniformis]|uniref:Uncharacterized protein n=1 Tax=Bacillus licheniformis TaxID=1402 RepID=A0A8B5YEL9_BACLI|nr:hypothetical protein [Bacillus licheniformis]TWL29766.1 hypothetical protein CHCC16736_3519 [Bacillus licheniformis]
MAEDTRRISEFTDKQRLKLAEIAEENTKRSEEGLTVIKKDDEWRR